MNLIDHARVIASVAGSSAAIDYPELPSVLAGLLEARQASLTPLQTYNGDRKREIEVGIHAAANKALTERNRRLINPRNYVGLLRQWLRYRYKVYSLEQLPCERVIRAALRTWTPPISSAETPCSNHLNQST